MREHRKGKTDHKGHLSLFLDGKKGGFKSLECFSLFDPAAVLGPGSDTSSLLMLPPRRSGDSGYFYLSSKQSEINVKSSLTCGALIHKYRPLSHMHPGGPMESVPPHLCDPHLLWSMCEWSRSLPWLLWHVFFYSTWR